MESIVVTMGFTMTAFGMVFALLFPALGMGGRHSVRVMRGGGGTVVTALGIPLSMMLLGVVTTVVGLYLP